jgi:Ca2+-binding EF-hand superfamily protein
MTHSPVKITPVMTRNISVHSTVSSVSGKTPHSPLSMKGKSRDGRRNESSHMRRNKSSQSDAHGPKKYAHPDHHPKMKKSQSTDHSVSAYQTKDKHRDRDGPVMSKNKSQGSYRDSDEQTLGQRSVSFHVDKGKSSEGMNLESIQPTYHSTIGNPGRMKRGESKTSTTSVDSTARRKAKPNKNDKPKKSVMKVKKSHPKRSIWLAIYEIFTGRAGSIELKNKHARQVAEALDLQPWHLRRMRRRFDDIDVDRSGNVSAAEFLEATGASRSAFTDKLFAMIDLDGNGTIEFDEFMSVIAMYCMFTKNEILQFCFDCFDLDKSGAIDEREFINLCRAINGIAPSFPANFKKALEDFDVDEDGLINYQEFVSIERRYPMILFPAFKLQDSMQRFSLGESTWLKILENYNHRKKAEEYKRIHGKPMPESFMTRLMSTLISWTKPKVQVRVHDEDEEEMMTPKSRKHQHRVEL